MKKIKQQKKVLDGILLQDGDFAFVWEIAETEPDQESLNAQKKIYELYERHPAKAMFYLGLSNQRVACMPGIKFLQRIASTYIDCLVKTVELETLREQAEVVLDDEIIDSLMETAPYMIGTEHLNVLWFSSMVKSLNLAYASEIKEHSGSVADYFLSKNPNVHFPGKIYFHLVESKSNGFPFAFLCTYAVAASTVGKAKHLPLKNALIEYGKNSEQLLRLLSTVHKASTESAFLSSILQTGEIFHPIGLKANEAYTFLKEVPHYESAGILCRIPNWWKKKSESSFGLAFTVGGKKPSLIGMQSLVDFNISLSMGGESITPQELAGLKLESDGLALIKGKWVEVDRKKLEEVLETYDRLKNSIQEGSMTLAEAMRMHITADRMTGETEQSFEVTVNHGNWLKKTLQTLEKADVAEESNCGDDFYATLRDYQKRGLAWLFMMKQLGFGACLADDMGLGKTLQVLALLNGSRKTSNERVLLVLPTSLIGNWLDEIERFSPNLATYVVHPQAKKKPRDVDLTKAGLYITTYGMLTRVDSLKTIEWDGMILDEAQAIKNPGTKQTRAVKQCKAKSKIVLTGTPIENRLTDLWSIFDFLNPGLLGNSDEFSRFIKNLEQNATGYRKLKQLISPFVLRRLKTDRNIIADLPDKVEMKMYAVLSKKQAVLYNHMVDELKEQLGMVDGIKRKGMVLAALLKFKQICNHPSQYLGQDVYDEKESGKYDVLRQLCETIREKKERVLIFTQFREIMNPLGMFLEKVFGQPGLMFHGGTPTAKRKKLIDRFQSAEYVPFMLLSIKAGGVGLNLTAANHVIHFDRWWNPAVENQATDRVFRIGQQKKVLVHKFITKGTVEEKIDRMIHDKMRMADELLPTMKETWITEMDHQNLMNLFALE